MNDFNTYFEKNILPQYRINRYAYDYDLNPVENLTYRIPGTERLDLTHLKCYTIDPPGCIDPDDGFSLWTDASNKSWFAIHIADPTAYFTPESDCFKAILESGVTHYPSGHKSIHLMPPELVEKASLKNGENLAVSVLIQIVDNAPVGEARIAFTKVLCDTQWSYTYDTARESLEENLTQCVQIANNMRSARESVGKKLSQLETSYASKNGTSKYQLAREHPKTKLMKQMIAEFAIFANSVVAYYLHKHLGMGVFRSCDSGGELVGLSESSPIEATDLLALISDKGITAEYLNVMKAHDLVGLPSYCHFTSPIRRAVDCICHFLLKSAYLRVPSPFTENWLSITSRKLDFLTKMERRLQFSDRKLRTLQAIHHMLEEKDNVKLGIRITGYTGLFLNLMLDKVDEFKIQVSYVLRVGRSPNNTFKDVSKYVIPVSKVNVPQKFDEGTIPELDSFIYNRWCEGQSIDSATST